MAIFYSLSKKLIACKELFYANPRSAGVVELDELCDRISMHCSLKKSMLQTAVLALSEAIEEELAEGKIVDLGEIGRFQVSCSSCGVERESAFCSSRHMKDAKIVFRPGRGLKRMLKCVKYKRVAVL